MAMAQFLTGGNTPGARESNDFYPTPAYATNALLERECFDGLVWEPACGDGAISKLLPSEAMASDIIDRGYGETGIDFLTTHRTVTHIITNPPYKLAQRFVEHSLECATGKVAMLLKLNFLEGQARHAFFQKTPLRSVHVFCRRLSFGKGDEASKGAGLLAYAWFVWEHGHEGAPTISWIR